MPGGEDPRGKCMQMGCPPWFMVLLIAAALGALALAALPWAWGLLMVKDWLLHRRRPGRTQILLWLLPQTETTVPRSADSMAAWITRCAASPSAPEPSICSGGTFCATCSRNLWRRWRNVSSKLPKPPKTGSV